MDNSQDAQMPQLESIKSLDFLSHENKRLQAQLSSSKTQLLESQSQNKILLSTIDSQHQILDDAVKQLESFTLGGNTIQLKYKSIQAEYRRLDEDFVKAMELHATLKLQVADLKAANAQKSERIEQLESTLVACNKESAEKTQQISRLMYIKGQLEVELKNCIQKVSRVKTNQTAHSNTQIENKKLLKQVEKLNVEIASLKDDYASLNADMKLLQKENKQLRTESTLNVHQLINSIQKYSDYNGKLDCVLTELDRKDQLVSGLKQELQVKSELNKRVEAIHHASMRRENTINRNAMRNSQNAHKQYNSHQQMKDITNNMGATLNMNSNFDIPCKFKDGSFISESGSEKPSRRVDDTFIREEHRQTTNTIDNVMEKIDDLERELNQIY